MYSDAYHIQVAIWMSFRSCVFVRVWGEKSSAIADGSVEAESLGGLRPLPLTQSDIEHILHGVPGLCVQDAASHAEPDDCHLCDHTTEQDAQVASAVVHQVKRAGLVGVVHQPKEHHGEDHKPASHKPARYHRKPKKATCNIPHLLSSKLLRILSVPPNLAADN